MRACVLPWLRDQEAVAVFIGIVVGDVGDFVHIHLMDCGLLLTHSNVLNLNNSIIKG